MISVVRAGRSGRLALAAVAALFVVIGVGSASQAATGTGAQSRLHEVGGAPVLPRGSVLLGRMAGATPLYLDVVLAPRDPADLARFVAAVSTPGSPAYRHYLKRGEFGPRFGPAVTTLDKVLGGLRGLGLRPGPVSPDRLLIPVHTTVALAERAFGTAIDRFRLPSGRVAFANVSAPRVPASIARYVQAVVGLDDVVRLVPAGAVGRAPRPAGPATRASGPAPCSAAVNTSAATADVLAKAYGINFLQNSNLLGQGQTIALFEPAAYKPNDIVVYQHCYKTNASVTVIPVDGGVSVGAGGGLEVTGDIEDMIGIAPDASIHVYETQNAFRPNWLDEWSKIVNDDNAQVISISWLACEALEQSTVAGFATAEGVYFQQAAAQGQTLVAASGDFGSEACDQFSLGTGLSVDDPASDPYATAVGGTSWTGFPNPPRAGEATWNDQNTGASGGGISSLWPMPSWQTGRGVINTYSSGKPCKLKKGDCRELPDVSALAGSPYYAFYCTTSDCPGNWSGFYGTSFATPLWAAAVALSNQSCSGQPPAGFLNPALYAIAAKTPSVFHDITTGNTDFTRTNGSKYPATAAYDLATGLGTPNWSTGTSTPGLAASLCRIQRLPSWPMFHYSAAHGGAQPAESIISTTTAVSLKSKWNKGSGTDPIVFAEPTKTGSPQELELTSTATELDAYLGTTGVLSWKFVYGSTGSFSLTSAPAASESTGLVYVGFSGSTATAVAALHATTGKLAWKVPWPHTATASCAAKQSSIQSPLTVVGTELFGQTAGGCVFALSATTGATLWVSTGSTSVSVKGQTAPTFVVPPGSVPAEILVGSAGNLVALNAGTGAVLFSVAGCNGGVSTPVVDGSLVISAGPSGLCAMPAGTSTVSWVNACGVNSVSSPVVEGGDVFVLGASGKYSQRLCSVATATGSLVWSTGVGKTSSPAVANGVVFVTAPKPASSLPWGLVALNAATGAVLYASKVATPVTSPAIANGWIFTGGSGFSS